MFRKNSDLFISPSNKEGHVVFILSRSVGISIMQILYDLQCPVSTVPHVEKIEIQTEKNDSWHILLAFLDILDNFSQLRLAKFCILPFSLDRHGCFIYVLFMSKHSVSLSVLTNFKEAIARIQEKTIGYKSQTPPVFFQYILTDKRKDTQFICPIIQR